MKSTHKQNTMVSSISSNPRVVVKKKSKKYGQGYQNDDGQMVKAQSFKFFGFFGNSDNSNNHHYDPRKIHNLGAARKGKRQLGFISGKQIFGNHHRGKEWIQQQKRRHSQNDTYNNKKQAEDKQFGEDEQVIYIEPSVAEKRLEQLRRMGRPFYDEDFPPNQYSLNGPYGNSRQWQSIHWQKISQKLKSPKIFTNRIQPSDIKQGYLGDCYFLAGLAALAQRPDRIFQLFLLNQINNMKYYSVKMIYRGKWRTIDLDQNIPFLNHEPAFSKSKDNQIWVIIIEKAWAKLYGSYKQLQGGFPEQPLHDLTGAPIKHIFLQRTSPNGQQQWKYLNQASIKQYSMVASSPPGYDSDQSPSGIFQGHAYTFLNATQIQYNNKKEKIVQLRNPWGQGQFKGRWSDRDPVWRQVSENQKRRVGYKNNSEDGMFFMSFADFLYEFRNVTIAEINDNASYVYESFVDQHSKGVFFTVEIKHQSPYSFQIDKTPERSFTGKMQQKYRYPQAWIEVGKLQRNQVKKFQGYISRRRTLYKSYDLDPGTYVAWVKVQFNPYFQKDYQVVLAIYSEYVCKIRLASREQAIKFSGDRNIDWTGQRKALNKNYENKFEPSPHSRINEIHFGNKKFSYGRVQNSESNKKGDIKEFDDKKKRENTISIANNNNKLISSSSKKKIRRIQTQHTKIQTIQEDENGQAIIKIQDNQTRKQSVSSMGNTKTKTFNIKNQSTQIQLEGITTMKKQKNKQTVTMQQQLPNGRIIQKVQTKQRQTEVMEEDDNETQFNQYLDAPSFNSSAIRSGIQNNSKIQNKSSILNKQDKVMNRQQMSQKIFNSEDFLNRNIIRYEEPDEQDQINIVNSSVVKRK